MREPSHPRRSTPSTRLLYGARRVLSSHSALGSHLACGASGAPRRAACPTDLFVDGRGFTTVGAAIAILLSCILAFFCLWAARAQSQAAGVQAACDAAALAAQNEVAEFVLSVRVADATLLTMSLTGLAALGVGTVCCCVPAAAPTGAKLLDAGKAILEKRDDVARTEKRALDAAQDALPVAAQAQAQAVLQENGTEIGGSGIGYVELVPADAPEVSVGFSDAASEAAQEAPQAGSEIADAAQAAEEAAQEASDARKRAWEHDCGNAPSPCMAERASVLSGITAAENPIKHSVDTWSFSDALARAKAYYAHRAAEEAPLSDSVEERVRSAMRAKFYEYALEELESARAADDGVSPPDIYFPELFSNTDGMRSTRLYTEKAYPVAGGALHAYAGCPGIEGAVEGQGSISELESGSYGKCSVCQFDASTLGKVASASTSIDNGFEHHYREVARAAEDYCAAQAVALPAAQEVKDFVDESLGAITQAFEDVAARRVEAYPPGRFGTLAAYAFDASHAQADSSFFDAPSDAGSFAAVSSAIMVEDQGENALSSLLDGVEEEMGPPLTDAGDAVLGLWGSLLDAYGSGVEGLTDGVSGMLDGIPLASASGLGPWASNALMEALESVGLEPANTAPAKPVIANSRHVAAKGDGPVAQAVLALKEGSSWFRAAPRAFESPSRRRARGRCFAMQSPGFSARRNRSGGNRRVGRCDPVSITGQPRGMRGSVARDGPGTIASARKNLGQMTVEAAVVLPVMAAIAFIVVNALIFVGDCTAFDIVARDAIRLQADDGFEGAQGAAEVKARIEEGLAMDHEAVEVSCERTGLGHVRYTASTAFSPPFLQGVSVFGINVPLLEHEVSMTVSPYRKGVVV